MDLRSWSFAACLGHAVISTCACASTPAASGASGQEAVPTVTVSTAAPTAPAPGPEPTAKAAPSPASWNITYDAGSAGWSKSGPDGDTLLRLSGPPGGPLGFSVTR